MFKKVGLILMFVAITIVIAMALYRMIFPPTELPPEEFPPEEVVPPGALVPAEPGAPGVVVTPEEPGLPPGVSPVAAGGVTQVTPVAPIPTASATMTSSGQLNFYNKNDGRFYRLDEDGEPVLLSDERFNNVDQATFSPQGSSAIIEYPDGANIFYDFNTGRQVTLPQHWEDFDFDPQGSKLASKAVGTDRSNRFLVVSNPDGSNARPVQELGGNDDKVTVAWSPNNQVIATSETGKAMGLDTREVYLIGQNHENFRSLVVEGLDFRPSWSPDGQQLMYSAASKRSDWKPQLWVVDAQGDSIGLNRRMLSVQTWADKCTYTNSETLYCAVPTSLPRGAGLQPRVADSTPDDIYKIDLVTGLQTRVAIPEGQHTVESIMVTPDGSKLYFTDKGSGMLNEIRLK